MMRCAHMVTQKSVTLVLVLAAWLAGSPVAAAQGAVSASDAFAVAPVAGATSAVAAATIRNPGMYDIYVVSATADVAGRVEFRDGPDAAAKPVKELTVPSFGSLDLAPQGMQMILLDLKRPLAAGDTVTLTFTLDSGATVTVKAPVRIP